MRRGHSENGKHYVAVPYPNVARGQTYGRYAVRFRADAIRGYKTAFLLWPDSNVWPRDGEIDFPEGDLTGNIFAAMHRQGATVGWDQDVFNSQATYPPWHTAVIEWTPGAVRFILDGKVLGVSTERIPNTPMHWVLQTETAVSNKPPSNKAAGHVQIDWAALYARAP